jgi:hypothetical protein
MADTKIDICSRALIELGANQIADFSGTTTESVVASQLYDATVRKVLSRHPWRFATIGASINKIESTNETAFDSAYQLPADFVALWNVRSVGDDDMAADEWVVYGSEVHINHGDDTLEIDYTRVVDESYFPAHFTEALEAALMHRFCGPLSHSGSMRDALGRSYEMLLSKACHIDSRQDAPNRIKPWRLISARR